MRPYLLPLLLFVAAVAVLGVSWKFAPLDPIPWAGLLGYAVASLWWWWTALTAPPPLWRHHLALWLPGILPAWCLWEAVKAMEQSDAAAIGVVVVWPVLAVALVLQLACAGLMWFREPVKTAD